MSFDELKVAVLPSGMIELEWLAVSGKISTGSFELQNKIYEQFQSNYNDGFLFLAFCDQSARLSPSLTFWRNLAGLFAHKLSLTPDIEDVREEISIDLESEELEVALDSIPPMVGSEYVDSWLIESIWTSLNEALTVNLRAFEGTVEEFVHLYRKDIHLPGRVYFHLVENKNAELPFAFLATYSTRLSAEGNSKHLPLKYALEEYADDNQKLLELLITVSEAAKRSKLINELMESGELFHPLSWDAPDAFAFFQEIPIYEEAGILCRIPNWWKGKTSSLRLGISMGESIPSFVGMDSLLDFTPKLYLDDREITLKEAKRLLRESEGLAFIKNKWITVDKEKLQQTIDAYQKAHSLADEEGLSLLDAMRLQLSPVNLSDHDNDVIPEVTNGKWLKTVFEKLRHPQKISPVKTDNRFKAKLRDYQKDGLNWICFLNELKLGACLADDMGLGKTIQILAFLNVLKIKRPMSEKSIGVSLLVLPASLLSNWVNEIASFFPELDTFIAHPELHKPGKMEIPSDRELRKLDLVISTYALVQRYEWVQKFKWNYVILDEAQAIKNPATKQTRAIKKLHSVNRLAMTGTPIENRLSDLWSLFDFLNPGMLGSSKEFGRFSKKLGAEPEGYKRLRSVVSPFLLRRLKTDKSIISDLPDKVEVKSWATLTAKQALLYEQIVNKMKAELEEFEGIQRKGMILSALMKFKQLCNHPSQYLGDGEFNECDSGKFARLREICQTIHEKREKVLVFTQFKEMTAPLSLFLSSIFQRDGLVLHGSIAVGKRKKLIEQFQSKTYIPYMVLSIKAGGVGLNLTEANHVIHFDRWWNPAVENQATDRVYRIGQKKNVMVHKFLTKGTVEEKIDAMLEAKSRLTAEVIAKTGENWITEMDDKQLLDMFSLKL